MYIRLEYYVNSSTFSILLNTTYISEIDIAPRFVRMANGQGYCVTRDSIEKLLDALGIEVE